MKILFMTSFAPIVREVPASQSFYKKALGLDFEGGEGDYVFTHKLDGSKHFGLWPLKDAAQSCFGKAQWPADIPAPQASIEFEVADEAAVAAAAKELEARGHRLIHGVRTEPWKQVLCRLLSPEGLLVGICYTPWFHEGAGGGT